ncbi:MAG: ATP-dependent DNA helicase RecG [Aquabacterium sp.]
MAPAASDPPQARTPARANGPRQAMQRLGLERDIDLALHLPLRHEDETRLTPLRDAHEGETVHCEATVRDCRVETRGRRQLVARLADDDGIELVARFLHFYPSHQKAFTPGARLRLRGELRGGFLGRELVHPAFKALPPDGAPLAVSLTPVYPASASLPQAYLRRAIASALQRAPLDEVLPADSVPAGLPTLREALHALHHPPPDADTQALDDRSHPAWQRLKFEELLAQQLSQQAARLERAQRGAPALRARPGGLHERLLATLPFTLTGAQRRVAEEVAADIGQAAPPMHRLLQGDVGSGKTVVAALAAAIAIDAGWQCALMAPTEILASQHVAKLVQWLQPLGVTVAWLAGSRKGRVRDKALAQVASGEAQLVVGTHAVIEDGVAFARLGLAVIDEQHRFGVAQRLALRRKLAAQGVEPHLLMMSATPIPRTLAMSYFADLDVSTLDELPPGRTPVLTKVFEQARRDEVIARVRDEVARGRQAYWVCPLIDDAADADAAAGADGVPGAPGALAGAPTTRGSRRGDADAPELRSVIETHGLLTTELPQAMVGLLHGRMPATEKAAVMSLFTGGQMALLVATTVIEVGVDVPNASLMVIEHAERFGLAQLHQLRGRVGRGSAASVCVLLYAAPLSPTGRDRLRAMAQTTDGFEIARRDLEIRGPGEFMGARQSGDALLRFADLAEDAPLLARARQLAPQLLARHPQAAQAHVDRWLGTRAEYLKA